MGEHIDEQRVRHIAHLARLRLTEEEVSTYGAQLAAVLEYMQKLNRLDTEGLEPAAHPLTAQNVFAEDEPGELYDADRALQNAPARQDNLFKVPRVLEGGDGA